MDQEIKNYVVGFAFSADLQSVLLIRKRRPQWQAGSLNGIGGHMEENEKPYEAMVREFEEEAGIMTYGIEWADVGCLTIKQNVFLNVFTMNIDYVFSHATTVTDEEIVVQEVKTLDKERCIAGLNTLIDLCRQRITLTWRE